MAPFTDKTVHNLKSIGRYTDPSTPGLNLQVKANGKKYWTFRFLLSGVRRDLSLGVFPRVLVKEAQKRAVSLRNDLNHGNEPQTPWKPCKSTIRVEDAQADVAKLTFSEFAAKCIANKRGEWRNAKHAAQWLSTVGAD